MRVSASASSEDRNKLIAMIAFGLVAIAYVYFEFFRDPAPAAPPPPPVVVTAPSSSPAPGATQASSTAASGSSAAAGTASTSAAPGHAAKAIGITSAALDPTLHMDAMLVTEAVEYAGAGRNIFSSAPAPVEVKIDKPLAPPRPQQTAIVPAVAPAPQTCPPVCPPVDLKFVGFFMSPTGTRQAMLLHGDDVSLAFTGEVVQRRYRVVSIAANSIQIEDMPNNNTQTLPLLVH